MLDTKDIEILKNLLEEVVGDRLDKIEVRLENVEARLDKVEADILNIQTTIENELRPNITIIAEGHLSLIKKFDEIATMKQEHDLLLIRLNHLENRFIIK